MMQVYIATYKHGLKGPTKIVAANDADARKVAFAVYGYTGSLTVKRFRIDDIVDSVTLVPNGTVGGVGVQPTVEVDYQGPTAKDILGSDNFESYRDRSFVGSGLGKAD